MNISSKEARLPTLKPASAAFQPWEYVLLGLLAIIAGIWTVISFRIAQTYDIGLAYHGGVVAWQTGRPETLATWISTPFLGMVMALVSRAMSAGTTSVLITILNVALFFGSVAIVWRILRSRLSKTVWWLSAFAAVSFAPALSSIWWRQLNLIVLALAVLGFWYLRKGRDEVGAILGALSILIKPIVILLPLMLLVRRRTRRTGALMIAWLIGLSVLAQIFLAVRAGSVGVLSPLSAYRNFAVKSLPSNIWVCHAENFSPLSTLCRVGGPDHWTAERATVIIVVCLGLGLYLESVWRRQGDSWAWFSGACLFSPMISPIAWSHYQVLLLPLFILLLVEFLEEGASPMLWCWLGLSFALAELVWRPFGSAPGLARHFFGGPPETTRELFQVFAVAAGCQYALLLTALLHFRSRASLEGKIVVS